VTDEPIQSEQRCLRADAGAPRQARGDPGSGPRDVPRTRGPYALAEAGPRGWGHLEAGEETQDVVGIGGRVVFLRTSGKLCFATLADGFTADDPGERLQVMVSLAEVGQESLENWKTDVDLGDFVFVKGRVIASRRGELSVLATEWAIASKALRPLPVLHKELSEETRVRQRYADLIVRQEARDMLRTRSAVMRSIRETLHGEGFLEVETPTLQTIHGGAAARPFRTHLNAFDIDMTMRIALELYLKRAMVGGADRVYEIGRIFRNEGIDSSHSAEFTMLESYAAWGDQFTIAATTQRIIVDAADRALGHPGRAGPHRRHRPRRRVDLALLLPRAVRSARRGDHSSDPDRAPPGDRGGARHRVQAGHQAGKLAMELFGEIVEHTLVQPTFVCDYPAVAQPLARPHRDDPRLVEAWDLIVDGVERATGFSELIDPVIQRERLTEQSLAAAAGDLEAMQLDEDFLAALELGAPPMGGMGMGIDRLLMLFAGAGIRETILFPLLRPQG
jgi:lysyl-tRNA synthetase class 2